jgi:hypothetical protein
MRSNRWESESGPACSNPTSSNNSPNLTFNPPIRAALLEQAIRNTQPQTKPLIELIDGLPLVKFDGGRVVAFRHDWLLRSILRAAEKAGYRSWWLAEHVAESVTTYLRLRCEDSVVALPRLEKAVVSVLQVIGYAEIASRFVPDPPIIQVSLPQLAIEAGAGFELSFFQLLRHRLHQLCSEDIHYIELVGLQPCVKFLCARKAWSRDCTMLQEEIVAFVREQLRAAPLRHEIVFALS